jgi:7,8-dihydro-6-hydroxymethylpterin-pyrophosphokinase
MISVEKSHLNYQQKAFLGPYGYEMCTFLNCVVEHATLLGRNELIMRINPHELLLKAVTESTHPQNDWHKSRSLPFLG